MKNAFIAFLGAVAVVVFGAQSAFAGTVPSAPVLLVPEQAAAVDERQPVIAGVAPADTRVAIYINDTFNGYAERVSEANGVQSFKYTPFLPLQKGAAHVVTSRAEDTDAYTRSELSEPLVFNVKGIAPRPVLLGTVVNAESTTERPWIVGLAGSGHEVDIYIDSLYVGTAVASEDLSGTGSFRFRVPQGLSDGDHAVVAIATPDNRVSEASVARAYVQRDGVAEENTAEVEGESASEEAASDSSEESGDEQTVDATTDATTTGTEAEATDEESSNTSEEPSEDEVTEDSAEEEGDTEEDEDSDEESNEEGEEESSSEGDTDEEGGARQIIGWALLIIAALILVTSFRRRQTAVRSGEVTPGPSTGDSSESSDDQLKLHGSKENKNIEVVDTDNESDSSESN